MDGIANRLGPFKYDSKYPFLFCTVCQYAVLVPSISDHLKGLHKDVPACRRKIVRAAAGQLRGMYQKKDDIKQFQFPIRSDAPIPHIRRPVADGNQCEDCGWITTSKNRTKTHRHDASGDGSGGRSRWRANVRCQQLFAKGPLSRWFEVGPDSSEPTSDDVFAVEDAFGCDLTTWLHGSGELCMFTS